MGLSEPTKPTVTVNDSDMLYLGGGGSYVAGDPDEAETLAEAEAHLAGGITPHEDVEGWMAISLMAEVHRLRREVNAVRAACDKREASQPTWQLLDEIERAIGYTQRDAYTPAQTGQDVAS